MDKQQWTDEQIKSWINSQTGDNYWYQTIKIKNGIIIQGTVNSLDRLQQLDLDDDLSNKTVLDIGCNSGMLCLECKRRGADRVVGIDIQENRLEQARILAEIMGLEIEYKNVDLFHAKEMGDFDIVLCIAILTEITDLLGGLSILKQITREKLYLVIATPNSFSPSKSFLGRATDQILDFSLRKVINSIKPTLFKSHYYGNAKLRKIESKRLKSWALDPDMNFLGAVMGDKFKIIDLGNSVRYRLFKMVRFSK